MLRSLSLRSRLAGAFLLIITLLMSVAGLYLMRWTESHYLKTVTGDLRRESRAVAGFLQDAAPGDVQRLVEAAGRDLGHRITIVTPGGAVIADSEYDPREMPNHGTRPEIRQALDTGFGTSIRYSATLRTRMLYVATAYGPAGNPAGVTRIAEPLSSLHQVMSAIQRTFLLAALAAFVLAALLSLRLTATITAPIRNVALAASKLADGQLTARTTVPKGAAGEVRSLASAFNHMAGQLQASMQEITEQTTRMQTMFEHTDDGLALISSESRIRMINPAACRMIGIDCAQVIGKTVIEGTLNHDLSGLVDRALRTREPATLDIMLSSGNDASVLAYVAPISRPDGDFDALVVLHDLTAVKHLDALRRDFVANVSHELRTPLASIKAMAETIVLRHEADPQIAEQLAESIVRESDRLTLLAQDLIELTETDSGHRELNPEEIMIGSLVDDVFSRLKSTAERKAVTLVSHIPESLAIMTDRDSLCQIVTNLVDNAVRYNRDGGSVTVSTAQDGEFTTITVADTGIGIPEEDLPRVFERFYRVDKARSRASGGTGLGLSIVKHLVESVGGRVSVSSDPGEGTTFAVTLPSG